MLSVDEKLNILLKRFGFDPETGLQIISPTSSLIGGETQPLPQPPSKPKMPFANSADAWWAAQNQVVQVLRGIKDRTTREIECRRLASLNYTIDRILHLDLSDPLSMMKHRLAIGMKWWPAIDMPPVSPPGLNFPGQLDYTDTPPPWMKFTKTDISFAEGYDF